MNMVFSTLASVRPTKRLTSHRRTLIFTPCRAMMCCFISHRLVYDIELIDHSLATHGRVEKRMRRTEENRINRGVDEAISNIQLMTSYGIFLWIIADQLTSKQRGLQ